ncbi:MAG: hypothetical protein HC886_09980 [Leptolyngbyaceae cyanobacterium SM1_1_3]|nr:hypothetical protein [Leptolyngbyaceae cyanobacterium SM1_1_3]NJN04429.1 hypothetical protein [Leptolyngbyaceae cyanobacterium RM1_1_2]NJO11025.1 hypothetical protein [Leptolyngbyaceae cyanobacterium SL_1_1]
MVHFHPRSTSFRLPVIQFAIAGLMAASLPLATPHAALSNDFQTCATGLLAAGAESEVAAAACASALNPDYLAECVTDIKAQTQLVLSDIVFACRRVRRPQELASCTTDIHLSLMLDDSASTLDSCRRSLLPLRFSDCVVGLNQAAGLDLDDALDRCIGAGYEPRDISPTFIPNR